MQEIEKKDGRQLAAEGGAFFPDDDDQPGVLIDLWFEGWTGVGPRAGLSLF